MKALCWEGRKRIQLENRPEPEIINPHDALIQVKTTAICGSDLHIYAGYILGMKKGDILGHEFAGEVVALGSQVENLKVGDRVVIPFTISCGQCYFCTQELWSCCDNTNPNGLLLEKGIGHASAGLYGYSHLYGGYPGGQAEFVRVPFANVGAMKIPDGTSYEQALFVSDILPTGWMAAENCNIKPGDTVAVWGCGPVGQFAIKSAFLQGAERVVAIDRFPYRLALAETMSGAITVNYEKVNVIEVLNEMTAGRGPDACIDAVGMEAHGATLDAKYDEFMQTIKMEMDRSHALREAIYSCRKGGVVSVPGVYVGLLDKFPMGMAFAKGLTFKMGQTHVPRYMKLLMDKIVDGQIDPTMIISHRLKLEDGPGAYEMFCNKEDDCLKVVMSTD